MIGLVGCKTAVMNKNSFCRMQLDYTDVALEGVNSYNRTMIRSQYEVCHEAI